jgi:hypothetical protein
MRFSVIVPGLIAALAISCLYVSRLNACDIGQNPYCSIDEIGPADSSASDNARTDTNTQADSPRASQAQSKHRRLSKSQRRARDAEARNAKANDSDKLSEDDRSGEIANIGATSIPAHALAATLQPQASEYAPLFSVQAAQSAIPTLQTIIPLVDPHTLNEIDRMADAGGASGDAANGGDPLNAMASMDMPDAAPSEWRKWLPFGETSLIGQIFVALGGLLTLATAVRMIIV